MKHLHLPLLALSLAALSCAAVTAAAEEVALVVPGTVNFQGRLATVDSKGALKPLTGVQRVDFRLCDAAVGGTTVWERQFPVTCTDDGSFNLTLDDGGTMLYPDQAVPRLADAFQGNERHFELSVDGYGTLAPRLLVTSSPYAFQAQYAAKAPGDFSVEETLTVGGNATFKGNFSADSGTIDKSLSVSNGGGTIRNLVVKGTLSVSPGKAEAKGVIPLGGILVWTKDSIPDGWAVCDGKNGTPDLSGLFVMGPSDSHPVKSTGGEAMVTLSINQMPRHRHAVETKSGLGQKQVEEEMEGGLLPTGEASNDNTETVGGGEAHENRPPYFAVYYIMRVK